MAVRRIRWACLCAWLLAASAPASAQPADPPRASLDWEGPCFDAAALSAAVGVRLEREAFVSIDEAELVVRGRLEPEGAGYRATLELVTHAGDIVGSRVLEFGAIECASLTEPIAAVLAIMLNVRRADLPPLPPPPPIEPPIVPPPEPPIDPLVERETPPAPWELRVGVTAGILLGLLPQPGLEVALSASGEERGGFGVGLELSYAWSDTVAADIGTITVGAASARVFALYGIGASDVRLAFRIAAGVGPMWAESRGFEQSTSGVSFFVELRAGMRLEGRIAGPLWIYGAADVGAVPRAPTFGITEPDETFTPLFRAYPVLGAFSLGAALRLE
jgi:hypothetical protein